MNIALVNTVNLPEPDPDEAPLLAALRAAGHTARSIAWDDPAPTPETDPAAFDACVIRATWNYHRALAPFTDWLRATAPRTRLINPLDTVLWNIHKRYLRDFESRRIPIVPTRWADRGSTTDLARTAADQGWSRVVIKPAVSAGSRDTRCFDLASQADDAQQFLDRSAAREDTMIQRYMPSVETGGEVAVICIGGRISHAIEKRPRFAGEQEGIAARPLDEPLRRFTQAVLDACPLPSVYARVDVMLNDHGGIVLSELELIEPSLYFGHGPGSAERMVGAIEHAATATGSPAL